MDFWTAMQASHNVVRNDYFGFTMFLLLMVLVNLLGVLCCVVGVLVTIPLSFAAITVAYNELVGFDPLTPHRICSLPRLSETAPVPPRSSPPSPHLALS